MTFDPVILRAKPTSPPGHPLLMALTAAIAAASLSACATSPAPSLRGPEAANAGTSVYGLYLAGETAMDRNEAGEAAKLFADAVRRDPSSALLRQRAFLSALLAGDVDAAAALAPHDGDAAASAALGRITRAVADMSEGHDDAAYAILSSPGMDTRWAAAVLLRPWAAAGVGDQAASLTPGAPLADHSVQTFSDLNHARLLERAGRYPQADAAYKALLGRGGLFTLAYGGFLERRGERKAAVALYDQALSKNPVDPAFVQAKTRAASGAPAPAAPTVRQGAALALVGPAALLLAQKQPEAGLAYLRLSLRLDPDLAEAWVLVGDAEEAEHDLPAARAAYGHVAPTSPEWVTAQGRIALDLAEEGEKAQALKLAQNLTAARPDDPHALLVLAQLYQDGENYPQAVATLDRLIAIAPRTTVIDWRLRFQKGAALEREGRWSEAETELKAALALHPDDPDVLNYLGFAWADRGEHLPEALKLLQKAQTLAPDSGAIVDSVGWAQYRLGDYPASVRTLERAVNLEPADPDINAHLGDAYWRTGRRLEAQYQWRRVLTLDPDAKARAASETKLAKGLTPVAQIEAGGAH